jgi:hypothetical protein
VALLQHMQHMEQHTGLVVCHEEQHNA